MGRITEVIAKGVGPGNSGELLSNTMKMSEKLLKLGGINFLNKKKKNRTYITELLNVILL